MNNNKGLAMQRHKKETRMESCFYGAGCTRPDCKYLHPTKKATDQKQSSEPCMPYLAGLCTFSAQGCRKRHPPTGEAEALIAKYQRIPCRFGESCKTSGCLYVHPGDEGADMILNNQGPAILGMSSQAFPPLGGGSNSIQSPLLHRAIPNPPVNSAWKPSPPTGHTVQSYQSVASQSITSAPVNTSMHTQQPLGYDARQYDWTSSSEDNNNSNNTLSIHAKEFKPTWM